MIATEVALAHAVEAGLSATIICLPWLALPAASASHYKAHHRAVSKINSHHRRLCTHVMP